MPVGLFGLATNTNFVLDVTASDIAARSWPNPLAAAEAALGDETFLAESIQQNLEGLRQLASGLDKIGLDWIPSVANFICARVGRNAGQIYQMMLERGVIVRPVSNYGLPEHLRISIGLESENARALKVLTEALTLSEV